MPISAVRLPGLYISLKRLGVGKALEVSRSSCGTKGCGIVVKVLGAQSFLLIRDLV